MPCLTPKNMKIEKRFNIREYNGKRELKIALIEFLTLIKKQSDFQTRLFWNPEKIIKKLTSGTCLMIMLGGEICGLVDYHVQPLPSSSVSHPKQHRKDTVYISDFIIHPRYRRIGLGKMLFSVVEHYSRYLGKKSIRTALPISEQSTRQFFERMGFEPTGIFHDQDLHLYEIQLQVSSISKRTKRNPDHPKLKQSHSRVEVLN